MSSEEGAVSQIVNALLSNEHKKKVIAILLLVLIVIVALGYGILTHYQNRTELAKATRDSINPPTTKTEDLREISKKLTDIAAAVQGLRNEVDAKISTDNIILRCGINNQELNKWEVSVSGKNTLGLKEGDEILLINSYSHQVQSAKFKVKFIRQNVESAKPEIYINLDSARYFDINDPERVGIFDLKAQKIK